MNNQVTSAPNVILTEAELADIVGGEMGAYADAGLSSTQANALYGDVNAQACPDGGTFVGLNGSWSAFGESGYVSWGICFYGSY